MKPDFQYALSWLIGSFIGYLLSRMVWRRFVTQEIGNDDNIFLTAVSLVLSWFLVAGSVVSLLIHWLMSGIDDTEVYWLGKTGTEMLEDEKKRREEGGEEGKER